MKIISTQELKELIDSKSKDYLLVDVREKNEMIHGMIPTAVNFPLSELEKTYTKLPKDKLIIVHCRSGGRSTKAAEFLTAKGFKIGNYTGSIAEWSKIDKNVKMY